MLRAALAAALAAAAAQCVGPDASSGTGVLIAAVRAAEPGPTLTPGR